MRISTSEIRRMRMRMPLYKHLFYRSECNALQISTVWRITEQKLCCTFNNCSLVEIGNWIFGEKFVRSLAAVDFLLCMRNQLYNKDFSANSHSTTWSVKHSMNFESVENVRSSNVIEFEFELRHIPTAVYYLPVNVCSRCVLLFVVVKLVGKSQSLTDIWFTCFLWITSIV